MRALIILGSVLVMGCGGGGGKKSANELGRAVADAVGKKDKAALVSLLVTADVAVDACPQFASERGELEKKLAKWQTRVDDALAQCAELDWSKATISGVEGGDAGDTEGDCQNIHEAKDVKVNAEIDGKKVAIVIDDPVIVKGEYYLFDGIKCRGGTHPAIAIAEAVATKVCACKDAACAEAASKGLMDQLMPFANEKPEADVEAAMTEQMKKMTDCMVKLSTP